MKFCSWRLHHTKGYIILWILRSTRCVLEIDIYKEGRRSNKPITRMSRPSIDTAAPPYNIHSSQKSLFKPEDATYRVFFTLDLPLKVLSTKKLI